jgi:hypothetical protein
MNRKHYNAIGVIWGSLLVLTLSTAALAQESSYEEKLVRSVYAKLMVYHRAAVSERAVETKTAFNPDDVIQFELRAFQTGPIEKIFDMPFGQFVTVPVGEIIQIQRERTQLPNGPEHLTYKARWEEAPGIMEDWSSKPVSYMLSGDEQVRASVRKYTSYEVRVRLKEREKIYRATAFFLEPLQSVTNSKPMIFDMMLGIQEMTELVEENRMPLISPWDQYVKTPLFERYKMAVESGSRDFTRQFVQCPSGYDYISGGSDYLWDGWCCDSGRMRCCLPDASAGEISCCAQLFSLRGDQMEKNLGYCGYDPVPPPGEPVGEPIEPGGCIDRTITFEATADTTGDITEDHIYGYHKAWAQFQGSCQYKTDCTVNCKFVEYGDQATGNREQGMRYWYIHSPAADFMNQPAGGVQIAQGGPQNGASIICGRAYAVAWRYCFLPPCGVTIKIEWKGTGFSTVTDQRRKWSFAPTLSCLLQPPATQ